MKDNQTEAVSGSESEDDTKKKKKKREVKKAKNVLTRMQDVKGPMTLLLRAVQEKLRVRVITRNARHVRGICTGFLVAFDWHCNLAMMDVDEAYKNPREKPHPPKPKRKRRTRKKKNKTTKDDDESGEDLMGYPCVSQIDGLCDSSEDDDHLKHSLDRDKNWKSSERRTASPAAERSKSRENASSQERSRRKRSTERKHQGHHSRHSTERRHHRESRRHHSSSSSKHSRRSSSLSPLRSSSHHRHESLSRRRSHRPHACRSLRSFIDENLKSTEKSSQHCAVTEPQEQPAADSLAYKPCRVRMKHITDAEFDECGSPIVDKVQEYCPVLERHVKQILIRGDNVVLVSIAD